MEGFLNLKWARWQRVLVTRTIAVIPTFSVAFFSQLDDVTKMNDYLNAVMALQLPFATIPTIAFSSSKLIMGDFANGFANRLIAIMLSIVVIGINIYFVINRVNEADLSAGWISLVGKFVNAFAKPQTAMPNSCKSNAFLSLQWYLQSATFCSTFISSFTCAVPWVANVSSNSLSCRNMSSRILGRY